MTLTKYTQSTDIILNVGLDPEDRADLNDDTFRSKWDENATNWKAFWNNTASAEIDVLISAIKGAGWTSESLKGLADLISTVSGNLTSHAGNTNNPHGVTAAQAGAINKNTYLVPSTNNANDAGTTQTLEFNTANSATLNTPYAAGMIGYTVGVIATYRPTVNYGAQMYFVGGGDSSTPICFIRYVNGGTWGNWRKNVEDNNGVINLFAANLKLTSGTGSPEGVVTAPVGSLYLRSDGGASTTLYVKQSGTGNTGWVAK